MSKLTEGQVEITLAGETITLNQTIGAALAVDRRFDNINNALQGVLGLNIDAMVFVITAGAGIKKPGDDFPEKVWRQRTELVSPLTDYLLIMRNGGKPIQDAKPEKAAEGN
jgi:hypothetical protein